MTGRPFLDARYFRRQPARLPPALRRRLRNGLGEKKKNKKKIRAVMQICIFLFFFPIFKCRNIVNIVNVTFQPGRERIEVGFFIFIFYGDLGSS